MKELAQAFEKHIEDYAEGTSNGSIADKSLDDAAVKWAQFALSTYTGKLLKRALAISASLAEFTDELYQKKPEIN